MSDDREFLSALEGEVVSVDCIVDRHLMVSEPARDQMIAVTIVKHVLVATPTGKQIVDHLGVKNANQLRQYPTGCRIKFCARVRQYFRADGSSSWGLSAPFDVELVGSPPAMRPGQAETSNAFNTDNKGRKK
jgi:hypothetical protein